MVVVLAGICTNWQLYCLTEVLVGSCTGWQVLSDSCIGWQSYWFGVVLVAVVLTGGCIGWQCFCSASSNQYFTFHLLVVKIMRTVLQCFSARVFASGKVVV